MVQNYGHLVSSFLSARDVKRLVLACRETALLTAVPLFSLLSQISSVDLSNQSKITDVAVFTVLSQCPNLRSLSARRCRSLRGTCFDMSPLLSEGRSPPRLSLLNFSDTLLKDGGVHLLCKHFGAFLEHLTVNGCKAVGVKGVKSIARHCLKIRSIDLGMNPNVEKGGVLTLLRKCRATLDCMNVGGCVLLDDEFVKNTMALDFHNCLIYRR